MSAKLMDLVVILLDRAGRGRHDDGAALLPEPTHQLNATSMFGCGFAAKLRVQPCQSDAFSPCHVGG